MTRASVQSVLMVFDIPVRKRNLIKITRGERRKGYIRHISRGTIRVLCGSFYLRRHGSLEIAFFGFVPFV